MISLKEGIKRFLGYNHKPYDPVSAYIESGNLIHGNNCKFEGLQISIAGAKKNNINISIGNDCCLSCNILLYSQNAKIVIGDGVFIGPNTTLFCYDKIEFENDIMISWGCTFIDTNAHSLNSFERKPDVRDWIKGPEHKNWSVVDFSPVRIKSNCWVGFNSIVAKGVTLNEGTVIGCGSVVTKSTEPYSVYAGNPAAFVKTTK